ncbi:MAG: thiol protease/hemagglutinin PrtT [Candidatus Cloacimonetes bacterium]|nr:thiol protease/hemagglutinin PrtT [Candidatus Cloacimonadota bacterium]
MKKIILLSLLTILVWQLSAIFQSTTNAEIVAKNFFKEKNENRQIVETNTIEKNSETSAYIFNLQPNGFIVVSSDDNIQPVIAYSNNNLLDPEIDGDVQFIAMIKQDIQFRKEFYANNSTIITENQKMWQDYLSNNIQTRDFQQWPPYGSTMTGGWVETHWNQSGIYSRFCPLDNSGQRSVVGCVATAMAMIIDYHKFVGNVSFDDSDDFYSGWSNMHIDNDHEERDFPSFPELNEYLVDLNVHYQNGVQLTMDDLSALNFACGISVHMMWSSNGSGAWTAEVADGLLNKFGFDSAVYIENNDSSFYDTLRENMIMMKPVELTIYTSGWNNGHAIICDGYNTEEYYHLNYGWGTSNNDCWYLLPEGMPANYSIVSGGVVNIEGGETPFAVNGNVSIDGVSPVGTYIHLEGDRSSELFIVNENGNFQIPALFAGTYTATASLNDRIHYQQFEIDIDESNNFIQFNLSNYEGITGDVTATVETEGCRIDLFQDEEILHSAYVQNDGTYFIPNVIPGTYLARASLNGNYYYAQEIEMNLDNMNFDFDLQYYPADINVSFAKSATDLWHIIANYWISCAIKLETEDLQDFSNDLLSKIRFKSPINDNEGEIIAQIWENNTILVEKPVEDLQFGVWIETEFETFIPIEEDKEYYIGYRIISDTGDLAWHDDGPRVPGKGAFFNTTNWIALPSLNDYNFCIEAGFISQEFATIEGDISLNGGSGEITDVVVKANNYISHPNPDGNYSFQIKPDDYALFCELNSYNTDMNYDIELVNGDVISDMNFSLTYTTSSDNNQISVSTTTLIGNYPNPFNPETSISFYNAEDMQDLELYIYNIKGQNIKKFEIRNAKLGMNEIIWNGSDNNSNAVSSGIYFYKLQTKNFYQTKKMILMK